MRKSDLRNKAIRRIKRFAITEEEIDDLIRAGEYQYDPEREDGEAYALVKSMIELLPENKRHDLMCLMYLGRNLAYYGLNEEVIEAQAKQTFGSPADVLARRRFLLS